MTKSQPSGFVLDPKAKQGGKYLTRFSISNDFLREHAYLACIPQVQVRLVQLSNFDKKRDVKLLYYISIASHLENMMSQWTDLTEERKVWKPSLDHSVMWTQMTSTKAIRFKKKIELIKTRITMEWRSHNHDYIIFTLKHIFG
jgi:hypothetical protein